MGEDFDTAFEAHYAAVLELARARLRRENSPISTITLAHELFLGVGARADLQFGSREQFLGYVSRAMRSLLVDMARERLAQKRVAELVPLTFGEQITDHAGSTPEALLALDAAMQRLGQAAPRLLQLVEMRAVLGMQLPEIAAALGASEATLKRDWQRAKAYLFDALETPQ